MFDQRLLFVSVLPISHVLECLIQGESDFANATSGGEFFRRQKADGEGLSAMEELPEHRFYSFGLLEVLGDQFFDLGFDLLNLSVIRKKRVGIGVAGRLGIVEHKIAGDHPFGDPWMFGEEFSEFLYRGLAEGRREQVDQAVGRDDLRGRCHFRGL